MAELLAAVQAEIRAERRDEAEAKALLKARWDKPNGLWYVEAARVTKEQAARWLP
ncbi:DUF5710 domain-containing protein [Kitasatospora sp. NPDC058170]|uniref:DUF5710 domain-containing protein n=1 Tax=Kitasatospora sp. NPDC058170 TaxID=3346364 RepID=UPI0036DBF133